MRRMLAGGSVAAMLLLSSATLAVQTPPVVPAKRSPYAKLAEPWPDANTMRERQVSAQNRPLFRSDEPLRLTLTADFKLVNKDRTEDSTKRYPATLVVDGAARSSLAVQLGTRGHFRLRQTSCAFVPLRVEFPREAVGGTVFEDQRALKLVTHCRNVDDDEQYTLREYPVSRIFGLLTPRSFRARLVNMTYVDAASGKPVAARPGVFIEDDDDVARRTEGRIVDIPNALFKDVDQEDLTRMIIFEYMIANADYSILRRHNVRLIQDQRRILHTAPYDFDMSGLVDTHYSIPHKELGIASVRERLYRGPCRTAAELQPALKKFREKKADIMAVYDSVATLDAGYRQQARRYLEEFYSVIENSNRAKRVFVTGC